MAKIIVPRTAYIRQLDSYRSDTDLLKIVTGVRRCGKSELLRQFRQHLIDDGVPESEIIYIDLERSRYVIDSERMLYETIRNAVRGDGCYIMIDEVHFVRGWERVVSTVKNEFRANMYLTGSNSNMLSDDLATHVTGRYATIHVMPFSFREFVTRYPIDSENGYTQRLYQYMRWGGMPIIDLDDDGTKNRAILRGVYDSILNNDIRPRVELDQVILENITAFMLSNTGNITSANRITVASSVGDKRTTERYLGELVKSFVFYRADRFDMIGLKHMETNAKFYPADTGLMNAILYGYEIDESALLECVVYLELIRRGYRVSVGSYRNREIDFTAWNDDGVAEFYQVALRPDDERTLKRELDMFLKLDPDSRRVLITMDRDEHPMPDGVELINAVDWLLERSLLQQPIYDVPVPDAVGDAHEERIHRKDGLGIAVADQPEWSDLTLVGGFGYHGERDLIVLHIVAPAGGEIHLGVAVLPYGDLVSSSDQLQVDHVLHEAAHILSRRDPQHRVPHPDVGDVVLLQRVQQLLPPYVEAFCLVYEECISHGIDVSADLPVVLFQDPGYRVAAGDVPHIGIQESRHILQH